MVLTISLLGRGVAIHKNPNLYKNISIFKKLADNMSLTKDEISRYSRQLLMEQVGKSGQIKLKSFSVLIIGCGGLGCPAGIYLAAAGIGKIGLVDDDRVEKSNLHRQVLHNEHTVGISKVKSALKALQALNSNIQVVTHETRLNRQNAIGIIENYDAVIDATDNALSRYLISDACVLKNKPLISGSALRFEGQLTVYHYNETTPCYRCLFPNPPPPGTVTNCSDGGVLGVVPGIIGSLQALEAIKIALGERPTYAGKLLLFDALAPTESFKTIQIREKKKDCISCGSNPTIGPDLVDYEAFCGIPACSVPFEILDPADRISWHHYKQVLDNKEPHILIDVRAKVQAEITKLPNATNISLNLILKGEGTQILEDLISDHLPNSKPAHVYIMCRRGIASQKALKYFKELFKEDEVRLRDIRNGLEGYVKEIDSDFPMY